MALPEQLFWARIEKELKMCNEQLPVNIKVGKIDDHSKPPLTLQIKFVGSKVPAGLRADHKQKYIYRRRHHFNVIINRNYPFEPPAVSWLTPVFHPNISTPSEGGNICIKQLEAWTPGSNLCELIRKIRILLEHPNPSSPLDTPGCTHAAMLMNKSDLNNKKH